MQKMTLLVNQNRLRFKRFELIETFDLEGLPDPAIVRIAQTELAADQRLAETKEATQNQRAHLGGGLRSASAGRHPRPDKPTELGERA